MLKLKKGEWYEFEGCDECLLQYNDGELTKGWWNGTYGEEWRFRGIADISKPASERMLKKYGVMLKVFEIDCAGVIYHVSGKDKKEAEDFLERYEMECNGHLEVPRDKWVTKEIEKHDYGAYIDGAIPDVLGCSEWCEVDE